MGEAKRRGTYAERKAAAIARDHELLRAEYESRRRRGKSITNPVLIAALAMAAAAYQEQTP